MSRTRPVAALAATLALFAAGAAHAQGIPNTNRGFQPPVKQKVLPGDVPAPPPPALPGAATSYEPAERTVLDLSPTDALFDAINRGDIAGAREAINRGADLFGHNVLGMTPVELSVDLGRNDITFLLLSLRGGSGPARPAPAATAAAGAPAAAPAKPARKLAATPARPAPAPAAARPVAPQQFAGPADPGTPNPKAGFLGFSGAGSVQ